MNIKQKVQAAIHKHSSPIIIARLESLGIATISGTPWTKNIVASIINQQTYHPEALAAIADLCDERIAEKKILEKRFAKIIQPKKIIR